MLHSRNRVVGGSRLTKDRHFLCPLCDQDLVTEAYLFARVRRRTKAISSKDGVVFPALVHPAVLAELLPRQTARIGSGLARLVVDHDGLASPAIHRDGHADAVAAKHDLGPIVLVKRRRAARQHNVGAKLGDVHFHARVGRRVLAQPPRQLGIGFRRDDEELRNVAETNALGPGAQKGRHQQLAEPVQAPRQPLLCGEVAVGRARAEHRARVGAQVRHARLEAEILGEPGRDVVAHVEGGRRCAVHVDAQGAAAALVDRRVERDADLELVWSVPRDLLAWLHGCVFGAGPGDDQLPFLAAAFDQGRKEDELEVEAAVQRLVRLDGLGLWISVHLLQGKTPVVFESKRPDFACFDGAASEALDGIKVKLLTSQRERASVCVGVVDI